jgi:hypothetical protein
MDTSDLTTNLVSEGIGIVITVLVIGGLLRFRERRRWRDVRDIFLARARRATTAMLAAWSAWLEAIATNRETASLSEDERNLMMRFDFYAFDAVTAEILVKAFLGDPVVSALAQKYRRWDRGTLEEMRKAVVPYIADRLLPTDHPAWNQLAADLAPPLSSLSDLVDRFPTMVNPQLARTVIRLSLDLDNLREGGYQQQDGSSMSSRTAVAMTISHGLTDTLALSEFLNKKSW